MQNASIGGSPPRLNQFNSPVSGSFNGQQVTLTVSFWNFPVVTYAGSYENDTFTMTVPNQDGSLSTVDYNHASVDDYNNAVQQLQQSVNQQVQAYENAAATATVYAYQQQVVAATATATVDEQQRLVYDLNNIGGAISSLNSDANFSSLLHGYSHDISSMQTDYQTEQNDASGGCSNYYQVGVDNYQVGVGKYQVGVDDYGLQSQINSVQGDITNVQDYVQKIQQHWNDLGQQPFSGVSANNVGKAVQNGNDAINQSKSNMQNAQSQASSFDAQASQIVQRAQALYNGMHC